VRVIYCKSTFVIVTTLVACFTLVNLFFFFTFSIRIAFIFIFVLKFLCLVCRLGVAGVRAWSFGPQAQISNKSSDTMCSDHINLTSINYINCNSNIYLISENSIIPFNLAHTHFKFINK
jgi:hypothetical protein